MLKPILKRVFIIIVTEQPVNSICINYRNTNLTISFFHFLSHTVKEIEAGNVTPEPQPEGEFTPAPKIFKETCHIDWNRTAEEIHNLVRGLSPYPAAWTQMVDVKNPEAIADVKIFQTAVSKDIPSLSPGEVKVTKNQLFVGTNDYPLEILSLQPAGKKRMEADAFLRGYSPMKFV